MNFQSWLDKKKSPRPRVSIKGKPLDNKADHYGKKFYDAQHKRSWESASSMVPQLLTLFSPKSVIDIGCGLGTWLEVFQSHGLSVKGMDGDWVPTDNLYIPTDDFTPVNLENLKYEGQKSDFAMSLEVAEHVSPEAGTKLVNFLTSAAPVVLFSAAIPDQGGSNHINEQWFDYWIDEFKKKNFTCRDAIRRLVWDDPKVAPWYKQNAFIFVDESRIADYPKIDNAEGIGELGPTMRFVHPELFHRAATLDSASGRQMISELFRRVKRRVGIGK